MTHPNDDELIERATQVIEGNDKRTVILSRDEAAALLRACKGRVRGLPRSDGDGGWTLPMDLLQDLDREVRSDGWDGCTAEVTEIIALSVERRILSALEPAPDHEQWNAAIEAAKAVVRLVKEDCFAPMTRTREEAFSAACEEVGRQIDKLKKGPDHE